MSPNAPGIAAGIGGREPAAAAIVAGAEPAPRRAWVTYADNPTHFDGALVMYRSLLDACTRYPFVVMVPEAFDLAMPPALAAAGPGASLRRVGRLDRDGSKFAFERYIATLNKLWLWTLLEFEKVCWLDADMICVANIDDVFDRDLDAAGAMLAMAPGCRCNHFKNPRVVTQPALCPHGAGGGSGGAPFYGNTGLVLTRPSLQTFELLLAADFNHPFADQDAINIAFEGRVLQLPSRYNYMNHLPLPHPDMAGYPYAVYHFCYGKPWDAANPNPLGVEPQTYALWREALRRVHATGTAPAFPGQAEGATAGHKAPAAASAAADVSAAAAAAHGVAPAAVSP